MKTRRKQREEFRGRPSKKHLGCVVKGCREDHRSKGFCSSHYQKHRRKVRKEEAFQQELVEKIWEKTQQKGEKIMTKDKDMSEPNTKWSEEEERALLRAMDKVDKNPPLNSEKGKRCPVYWNEVAVILRLDSKYRFNRTGKAGDVRYNKIRKRSITSDFKERTTGSPGFSQHWDKIGGEVVQIRSDISQTYEKVAGLEHSVVRLEGEVGQMRESIQNIEKMIVAVCRSYGLPEGG